MHQYVLLCVRKARTQMINAIFLMDTITNSHTQRQCPTKLVNLIGIINGVLVCVCVCVWGSLVSLFL